MNDTQFSVLKALILADRNALTYREITNRLGSRSLEVSNAVHELRARGSLVEIGNGTQYSRVWAATPNGHRVYVAERDRRDQIARKEAARRADVLAQASARVDRQAKGVLLNYTEVKPDGLWAARLTSNVVDEVRRVENIKPKELFPHTSMASFLFVLPSRRQTAANLTPVGSFPTKEQAVNAAGRILQDANVGQTYIVITKLDMVREVQLDYVQ